MEQGGNQNEHGGHRERLRSRFMQNPESFSEAHLLELILAFAIPRRDVAPLAQAMLQKYGDIWTAISAPVDELRGFDGMGESTVTFLKAIETICMKKKTESQQFALFDIAPEHTGAPENEAPKERAMRVFANDEVANALALLPKAVSFSTLREFKDFLEANLPYNSIETRHRRAQYIIDRFFPFDRLTTPLHYFLSHWTGEEGLKAAIFYHVLQSEPAASKIAEELIYPALPSGRVERDQLKEFIKTFLPEIRGTSINKMLTAVMTTYNLLGVGSLKEETLKFHLRPGDFEGFLYVFTAEFPAPGIYTYDQLYQSPVHLWLLWDKEWIRKQLFALRDLKIVAKVSEIDTVYQFTLDLTQADALRMYFDNK